jgi:TetR/AcrR family transcriptional regulator, transcriptional repressor for nem operon
MVAEMGGPQESVGAVKRDRRSRERILEAASTLFHQSGYNATSLDDILGASGVCRSNFYYHFKSKEDLAMEVLQQQAEMFESRCIAGILENRSIPARVRLQRLFEALAAGQRAEAYRCGCPFGNLAAELAGVHPEFRRRLSEFFWRWEESVDRCLQDGVRRGEFRSDLETRPVATALVSQIEGAILLTKTHRHEGPIEAGILTMLTLLGGR